MITVAQAAGGVLVVLVLVRAGLALMDAMRRYSYAQEGRRLAVDLLREKVEVAMAQKIAARNTAERSWTGYRKFEVERKVGEANDIASFYLVPHNRRPLPPYRPGQYLTFRLHLPDRDKPLIRCYSLSDAPEDDHYRITVKRIGSPPDRPEAEPGLASSYLHDAITTGDLLDVMAPSGQFTIDENSDRPVVLLAGGIGITPLLSMLNAVTATGRARETWFFYGVRDGGEEIMAVDLQQLAEDNPNLHLVRLHSDPGEGEVQDEDFDFAQRINLDLLRKVLPSSNFDFYICGPSPMMKDLFAGLRDWGVPEENIHYEAFGAASVQNVAAASEDDGVASQIDVTFERSGKTVTWTPAVGSILDLAEKNDVAIDYGCRAGNCGTCLTAVRSGEITYLGQPGAAAESGTCLTCISVPKSPLSLDA
jgi:uncharacterized protein